MARLIAVVIAALALQATCDAGMIVNVDDAFDKLKAEFKSEIEDIVEKIENTTEALKNHVINEAEEMIDNVYNGISDVLEEVKNDLNAAVEKAADIGEKLIMCPLKIPGFVDDFVDDIKKTAVGCVLSQIQKAVHITDDLVLQYKKINDTINSLESKLDACGKLSVFCKTEVYTNSITTITAAGVAVTADVAEATDLIANFKTNIATCEATLLADLPGEVVELEKTIVSCYKS